MNKKNLLIALLSAGMILTSCGGGDDPTPPDPPVVEDEYAIVVSAPTGVSYDVSATRAKKGETITLTITSVSDGFSIKDVRVNNGSPLTPEADGKTYKFTMPNRSASIVIRVAVSGDVVLDGDIAVKLNETSSGVYEAKNVKIASDTESYLKFNLLVGSTPLKALDLDESNSFGDVSITFGDECQFEIATGCSYDFKYDSNLVEAPFTVKRVKVDVLPSTVSSLASILLDGYAVRSEPAMYIDDLVGVSYTVKDTTTKDVFWHNFEWKKYKDNTTFATIKDKFEENPDMYVYRHFDNVNRTYEVVDTYSLKVGDKTVNDDRFRDSYNNYTAYSARYDVIDEDDYGHRYAKSLSHVSRELRSTSHNPAYLLEKSIMRSYRVGFTEDDEISSQSVSITSEATATGFKTVIDSFKEYDSSEGTYTTDHHEAFIFDVTIEFDARGAVTKLDYKKTVYNKDQWDFVNHKPATGVVGNVRENIKATYTYGNVTETCSFDPSPYFIKSIDKFQFVSDKLADRATDDDSYLSIADRLKVSEGGIIPNQVSVEFTPSTALDLWQYGPTSSSDESVIAKIPQDVYYEMSPITEGDATVTLTNHVDTDSIKGATKDVKVHVIAPSDVRRFYIYAVQGDPSYTQVETAESAIVHANGQYKFRIAASPSDSPTVYHAVSNNPDYLTIVSKDNAPDFIIDTTGAKAITSNVAVTVTIESTRYDKSFSPTVLTFYIIPAQANPVGTWNMDGQEENVHLYFTETPYTAEAGTYQGRIVDHYIDKKGVDHGTDTFYFYYKYNGAYVDAKIYDVDIKTESGSYTADDFYLEFYYDAETGRYGVFLAEATYDDYYEDAVYDPILGSVDDDTGTIITGYAPFSKVKDK